MSDVGTTRERDAVGVERDTQMEKQRNAAQPRARIEDVEMMSAERKAQVTAEIMHQVEQYCKALKMEDAQWAHVQQQLPTVPLREQIAYLKQLLAHYKGYVERKKKHDATPQRTATYNGEWRDGRPHGTGTMTYADGRCYHGEWDSGQPHGRGTMHTKGSVYHGDWREGWRHGKGTTIDANGDVHNGEWDQNVVVYVMRTAAAHTERVRYLGGPPLPLITWTTEQDTTDSDKIIVSCGIPGCTAHTFRSVLNRKCASVRNHLEFYHAGYTYAQGRAPQGRAPKRASTAGSATETPGRIEEI